MRAILTAAALAAAAPAFAQPAPTPPTAAPAPCAAPEHRRLDFWVGRWDVSVTGAAPVVAHSLIERLYGGCALRENWSPLKGQAGGSLSAYDARTGKWRQTWADGSGAWVNFEGGWNGRALVITGLWPGQGAAQAERRVRMTYSAEADGAVRQLGEQSLDQGKTWTPSFDFTYRPAG